MYAHTGYEALYHYLGLSLQSAIREVLISESFFKGMILAIFGALFFMTTFKFFSRYFPGTLVSRQTVPLSKYFWIVASLFLGLSILRVDTESNVKNYKGNSWAENPYVAHRLSSDPGKFKVSLLFDILSKSAHEFSALTSRVVDNLFAQTHSQLEAPDYFYKAIMFAGNATIEDPQLKQKVDFYTEECLDKVIHLVPKVDTKLRLFRWFFNEDGGQINEALDTIQVKDNKTCLDIKKETMADFLTYTEKQTSLIYDAHELTRANGPLNWEKERNLYMSSALVNHYLQKSETWGGISKGAQVPGMASNMFQYLYKIFSWDGILSIFGRDDLHGASLAAKRSEDFSQLLSRAPHVKGFIVMILIASFPLLIFPVVAGRAKLIIWWFLTYFSVLLWTPIWTLFYHVITNIALASDTLSLLGELNDGISLYSAKIVTSRVYYLYSIYSWLQVLSGPFFTGLMLMGFRPLLRDTENESAPSGLNEVKGAVGTVARHTV